MEIRKTRMEELDDVMAMYDQGRQFMRRSGNMVQWIGGYPSRERVMEDIASGNSYIVEEHGERVGVFYYMFGPDIDPTYREIDGAWLNHQPYGVIHRIVSTGRVPGVVAFCSDWALERCPNLRIDTHADNRPMQDALLRCGFRHCGMIWTNESHAKETERAAFQKIKL